MSTDTISCQCQGFINTCGLAHESSQLLLARILACATTAAATYIAYCVITTAVT